MGLDRFKSTHPVVQQIRTVEQTNQAFDAITYQKGESVIAMLEDFAGADVWRAGIRGYIGAHAYQNSRTSDLWAAMEAAGANGLEPDRPRLHHAAGNPADPGRACTGRRPTVVTLTQGQFSADRQQETAANPLTWHVPVARAAGGAM